MADQSPWPPFNEYGPAEKKATMWSLNVLALVRLIKKGIKVLKKKGAK
jgi:hypothetical protein